MSAPSRQEHPEAAGAAWLREETGRNLLRMKNFAALALSPEEPAVGPSPREEVYRKGKARLLASAARPGTRVRQGG